MNAPLRPMTLGEIFDRTFEIYRARFCLFVSIAAVPALGMLALKTANRVWWKLLPDAFGTRVFLLFTPQLLLYLLAVAHVEVLLNLFMWPALGVLTSEVSREKRPNLRSAVSACLARWRGWIGITFVNWAGVLILPELVVFALLAGSVYVMFEVIKMDPDDPGHLGPKMFLASLVLGWAVFQWISAGISASVPVWAIESMPIRSALRRSWSLSKGARLRLMLARIIPNLIGGILAFTIEQGIVLFLYFLLKHTGHAWVTVSHSLTAIEFFAECAAATFVVPFYPIALTLLYYDQRIRREGYDIDWMMSAAGLQPPESVASTLSAHTGGQPV